MEYFPELIVFHVPPYASALRDNMRKAFRYGRGKGALVSKWLVHRHHWVVCYELGEMLIIPFANMVRYLLRGQWNMLPVQVAALVGRILGLFGVFARRRS